MSRAIILSLLTSTLILVAACKSKTPVVEVLGESAPEEAQTEVAPITDLTVQNSQTTLDWEGLYAGTIPCADCEGIEITLAIQEDGAYYRSSLYKGKSPDPVMERGKFQWSSGGSHIRLTLPTGSVQWYQVVEGYLLHVDENGKRINGDLADNYLLTKAPSDPRLEGKVWQLLEIMGESIEGKATMRKPHLNLDGVQKRVRGNDGCNSYSGGYTITKDFLISFSEMARTEMFCEDDEVSDDFYQGISQTHSYKIEDDQLDFLDKNSEAVLSFQLSATE